MFIRNNLRSFHLWWIEKSVKHQKVSKYYETDCRDRIYIIGYGFLSFPKNMGKNLINKYGQKSLDSAKKSSTDPIKTASKRAIQKTAEATGDLIGNKSADKIANLSKKSSKELQNDEIEVPKERTYLQKKDSRLLMN